MRKKFCKRCCFKSVGKWIVASRSWKYCCRFFPPFNVTNDEIDKAISILEKVFEKISF